MIVTGPHASLTLTLPNPSAVAERPQHMLMRVAIGIHREDLDAVLETYTLLSEKWFTHASPTLFNAGTCRPQLSSCFLLSMKEDSIDVGGLCTSHITSLCSVMTPTPPPPTGHLRHSEAVCLYLQVCRWHRRGCALHPRTRQLHCWSQSATQGSPL